MSGSRGPRRLWWRRRGSDRGATAVEYALAVGLVAIGMVAGIRSLEDGASSRLSSRGNAIGHPDEGVTTTSTTTKPGPGTSTTTTSTTAPFSVVTQGSCTGSPSQNECSFTLDPPPDPASTVVWSITPTTGVTGTLPGPVVLSDTGKYTVQATVDGVNTTPLIVQCKKLGSSGNIECTPQ